jgi:hypothetical protein
MIPSRKPCSRGKNLTSSRRIMVPAVFMLPLQHGQILAPDLLDEIPPEGAQGSGAFRIGGAGG